MKKARPLALTAEEKAALDAVRNLPDSDIALDDPDAPEVRDWSGAIRGAFFRSVKKPIAMRIDADILAWFKSQGDGYQTRINEALREHVERHRRR